MKTRPRLVNALLAALVLVLTAEIALRLPFVPLPHALGNRLFACWGRRDPTRGIDFWSPQLQLALLKPRFRAPCYWNGYRWEHQGDAWGFRNVADRAHVEVTLVGDSIVYGIGVQADETVAAALEKTGGFTAANLGQVGKSFPDYLAVASNFALPLEPKVVVVLAFSNDLAEIAAERTEVQQRAFVASNEGPEAGLYSREELLRPAAEAGVSWGAWLSDRFLLLQTLRFLSAGEAHAAEALAPDDEEALALAYADRALALLAKRARERGAALVVGYLAGIHPEAARADALLGPALERTAAALEVPFWKAGASLFDENGALLPGMLLPADGHLTPAASTRVAQELAAFLKANGLI